MTVFMSWTSTATNIIVSGMRSGSIWRPIFMAVGRFTSWEAAWAMTSSKSCSDISITVPGPYSPVWMASTTIAWV